MPFSESVSRSYTLGTPDNGKDARSRNFFFTSNSHFCIRHNLCNCETLSKHWWSDADTELMGIFSMSSSFQCPTMETNYSKKTKQMTSASNRFRAKSPARNRSKEPVSLKVKKSHNSSSPFPSKNEKVRWFCWDFRCARTDCTILVVTPPPS